MLMPEPSLEAAVEPDHIFLGRDDYRPDAYLDRITDEAEEAWKNLCSQYGITHNDYPGNYFNPNPDRAKN